MSHELVAFRNEDWATLFGIFHDFRHDLESFLFTFCWLCTTQAGPNSKRRSFKEDGFANFEISSWVQTDCLAAASRKREVVEKEQPFKELIVSGFHEFFGDCGDLASAIRGILYPDFKSAYKRYHEARARGDMAAASNTVPKLPAENRQALDVFADIMDVLDDALEKFIQGAATERRASSGSVASLPSASPNGLNAEELEGVDGEGSADAVDGVVMRSLESSSKISE